MPVAAYLELVKFRYHFNFLIVIFAALIFAPAINGSLLLSLFKLYVSFNLLFYAGIYTLNDLRDLKSDSRHPVKRNRPLPSGRISAGTAALLAAALISSGMWTGFAFFGLAVLQIYCALLVLNIFYSFHAREVPYLELVINSSTHPLRFVLGVLLAGRDVPLVHLCAYFAFIFGLVCLRRELERDIAGWEARRTLKVYSGRDLAFLEILCFAALIGALAVDGFVSLGFYSALIGTYIALVAGGRYSRWIRGLLRSVWLR